MSNPTAQVNFDMEADFTKFTLCEHRRMSHEYVIECVRLYVYGVNVRKSGLFLLSPKQMCDSVTV